MTPPQRPQSVGHPNTELGGLLDSIPVPLCFKDRAGRYAWFNAAFREAYREAFKLAVDQLLNQTVTELLQSHENSALVLAADEQVLTQGATPAFVVPHVYPSGECHHLLLRKAPYREPDSGEICGVITMVLDVTDLTQAQRALTDSERKYRELVEGAHALIMGLDCAGHITLCNESAEGFFGYTQDELLGRPAAELRISPLERPGRGTAQAVAELATDPARHQATETECVTRDGRRVWVSWTNSPTRDGCGRVTGLQAVGQDVTRRREIEERLRVSEAALESSMDAIAIIHMDGTILRVNRAFLNLAGYTESSQLVGLNVDEFLQGEEVEEIVAALQGEGWVGEREYQRPNGEHYFARISANLVRTPEGQPLSVMVSMQNVTARKLAERELQKFKLISDTAAYGSVIFDMGGRVQYCNEAFAQMHGYAVTELLGQSLRRLHSHADWEELRRLRDKLRADGCLVAERVWRQHRDGRRLPSLVSISYVSGRDAGTPLFAASLLDISDLDEAMAALSEQKERLAVTLGSIGDGVIATDTEGRVTLMNPVAEALTGWAEAEALGRPAGEILQTSVPGEPGAERLVETALSSGQSTEADLRLVLIARDGTERRVAGVAAPIRRSAGETVGAVVAFHDITEQEQMRQEVYQAHRLESLGLLAGGIAHDLNNLLTPILGGLELARVDAALPPDVREGLQAAEQAALQARYLSQQLLTFSRGGSPITRPMWIADLVRGSADVAVSGTNCQAEVLLPDGLWAVAGDATQLRQALSNVVLNAVQAMPEGGMVCITGSNVVWGPDEPSSLTPGRYVRLVISDSGTGIAPEALPRVFDPYFTTKPSGTGLGLTIAYSVVARHQGLMQLESRPGEGTRLVIHLPASDQTPVREAPAAWTTAPGTGRVLVMDDDPYVRKVVGHMLRHLGYQADIAADGAGALACAEAAAESGEPYRVAILDLTIKGGPGGAQVLGPMRSLLPDLKALACSGYHGAPVMANAADYGFDGVVVKPYQLRDLAVALEAVLGEPGACGAATGD